MPVTLIARDQVPLDEIAAHLEAEDFKDLSLIRMRDILQERQPVTESGLVILISQTQDSVEAGEDATNIRQKLPDGSTLVLCTLRPPDLYYQMLLRSGVNEIISPAGLNVGAIAERILGHLILGKLLLPNQYHQLRGATRGMRELYEKIDRWARRDEHVLILGGTGTGKGLITEVMHSAGELHGELIHINCAAINNELIESELFGHLKGAFTGADMNRIGLIAAARNGTAFFDEIGDLSSHLQIRLLDVLDKKRIRRGGANVFDPVNARFVFATHRDLEQRIRDGLFRDDFYARIHQLVMNVPPLCERKADLPLLVDHFLERHNQKKKTCVDLQPGAIDELFRYDWPHNVRELEATLGRAIEAAGSNGVLTDSVLREAIRDPRAVTLGIRGQGKHSIPFNAKVDSWPEVETRAEDAYFSALANEVESMEEAINRSGRGRTHVYGVFKRLGLKLK